MKTDSTEVLIVGAGPTGLLLACELARQEIPFRIIDRAAKPSTQCRALGVHSRSLEIFEDYGLAERMIQKGRWLPATSIYRDRELLRRIELGHQPTASEPYPSLLIFEQAEVERVLTEALAARGVEVERSCELKNLAQSETGVRATISEKKILKRLNCRYLIGCDGPRSRVRDSLGIEFNGFTYPLAYTLAEVRMEWDLAPEMHRFLGEGTDLLAIPLGEDRFRLTAWTSLGEDHSSTGNGSMHALGSGTPTLESVQEAVDRLVPGSARIASVEVLTRYKMELRLATSYGGGRCFLAGDACHVHAPTGAQGMNAGLQDAYNLGWKLAAVVKGDCPPELLRSYEEERRPVAHWVLNNTHQATAGRFEVGESRFFILGRKFLMSRWSQLSVNYRNSSIVRSTQAARDQLDLHAGDRAPDGLFGSPPKRLFDLFRGCKHHLLLFADDPSEAFSELIETIQKDYGQWIDVHLLATEIKGVEEIATTYAVEEPTAILVRPDGYLGARVGVSGLELFAIYLKNSFLAGADLKKVTNQPGVS